jgi:hypothetical protein
MKKFMKTGDSKKDTNKTTSSSSSSKPKARTKTPEPIKVDYEKDPQ